MSSPGFKVRVVVVLLVPGSLPLWVLTTDGGLDWVVLSESPGSSLSKRRGSSGVVLWLTIVESGVERLLVDNVVDVVTGGGIGVSRPGDLIGLVILPVVPGVVPLDVWGDV